MNSTPSPTPAINTATETECAYTFRTVHAYHRHVPPGTIALLLVEDAFGADLRSGTGWVEVLACSDHGVYQGRIIARIRHFPEIVIGEQVNFRLEHVLDANGRFVTA